MKINGTIVFEVTRRCNMNCKHCAKGKQENLDIDLKIIDKVLDEYSYIKNLYIIGGEPTLVPEILRYIIEEIKSRKITVEHFLMISNGKICNDEILDILDTYNEYQLRKDHSFSVSLDEYHSKIDENNLSIYRSLSYYDNSYEEVGRKDWANCGNAKENNIGNIDWSPLTDDGLSNTLKNNVTVKNDVIDVSPLQLIYVTAKGNVCFECPMEYVNENLYSRFNINDISIGDYLYNKIKK